MKVSSALGGLRTILVVLCVYGMVFLHIVCEKLLFIRSLYHIGDTKLPNKDEQINKDTGMARELYFHRYSFRCTTILRILILTYQVKTDLIDRVSRVNLRLNHRLNIRVYLRV